jgi:nitrite reductase/ring-hydroxylating ferredoxin subunit
MTEASVEPRTHEFVALGPVDGFPLGKIIKVEVDGRTVGVVRTPNGIRAIGNRCPHQGGPMCAGIVTGTMAPSERNEYVYEKDGEVVRCPWHGYEFELETGRSVGGAVRGRVPVYTVEVRRGDVYLSLRRAAARAAG